MPKEVIFMDWEFAFLDSIKDNFSNPVFDEISKFFGDAVIPIIIVAMILLIIFKKTRRTGIALLISTVSVVIIGNLILKPAIARVRPYDVNTAVQLIVSAEHDFSFPSAHTYFAFTTATVIFMRYKKIGICCYILAILMALSRMYLYVHYPTDVIAGAIFGIGFGIAGYFIEKALYNFISNRKYKAKHEKNE